MLAHFLRGTRRVWVSDRNNLILTYTATGKRQHVYSKEDPFSSHGIHTVNCEGELICIDKKYNIIKLCNDMKTTTTLKQHSNTTWRPECLYCSPSSGDQLVGMWRWDTDTRSDTGKVMRYDNTSKCIHTIPHDNNTPHTVWVSWLYNREQQQCHCDVTWRNLSFLLHRTSSIRIRTSATGNLYWRDVTHPGVWSYHRHHTDVG